MPAIASTDPATPVSPNPFEPRTLRRVTVGAALGSLVEWFDVAIFGSLAVVLGQVFFPGGKPAIALLSTFAVFGVTFVVRPLGGLFFGRLGDRFGRRKTLFWVLLLVSAATFGNGLLPSYATGGILSPLLLVTLRLIQGFSAGGEVGGASAFVAEHAPPRRRGYLVSWVEVGMLGGFLLGSLTALLLEATLTAEQLQAWGWRLPFLVAAPLGAVGLYIRNRLEETPEFAAVKERGDTSRRPLTEIVTRHWPAVLRTAGFSLLQNSGVYVVLTFVPTYLTKILGHPAALGALSSVVSGAAVCLMVPIAGALSDRFGRRPVLVVAATSTVLTAYPLFALMERDDTASVIVAQLALTLILGVFLGPVLAAMNELFDTRVRFGGFSLGYNISAAAFGGTAPFLVTLLIQATGLETAPAFYLMAVAAISCAVVLCTRETAPARN